MKNNKFKKSNILKIIENLYKLSGRREIPDVSEVCLEAKIDRQAAVKFLYAWWGKYHTSNYKKIEQLNSLADSFAVRKEGGDNLLAKANASIECLYKEVELHNELLNNVPNSPFPLGNYIVNSLQEIENQLSIDLTHINELRINKKLIQDELNHALKENNHLYSAFGELKENMAKEVAELQEKLDASRREALAAKQKLKSLKRDKHRPAIKNVLDNVYLT
jgi:hypothetical protein